MYLRILMKDLKRKKTMNFIILLFVVLSTMFFASGVNNIISIATGLDHYLDMAGLGDYIALVGEPTDAAPFEDKLKECTSVTGWRKESVITLVSDNVRVNGHKMGGFSNAALILAPDTDIFRYYDVNNAVIEDVPEGKVYITNAIAQKAGLTAGDVMEIDLCGKSFDLVFAGSCKDAALGSDMMDNPRFLVNSRTFGEMFSDDEIRLYHHSMYYVDTADTTAMESILSDTDGVRFSAPRSMIKM